MDGVPDDLRAAVLSVPFWLWLTTGAGFVLVMLVDLVVTTRKPHESQAGERARWFVFYLASAISFGLGLWLFGGTSPGLEFTEEFVSEAILALELIIVIGLICRQTSLPEVAQQQVLMLAIMIAMVLRSILVLAGSSLLLTFSWLLYASSSIYVLKAVLASKGKEGHPADSDEPLPLPRLVGVLRRVIPMTDSYHGMRSMVRLNGRRMVTPKFMVVILVGTADLLVAPNTTHPYIIITANFFALLGTRALFAVGWRIPEFVDLIRPGLGLVIIFILVAIKLFLQALAASGVRHIGNVRLPSISPAFMAIAIVLVMTFTVTVRVWKQIRARGAELVEED
jgi:tellurite resistance protein TerC